MSAIAPAPAPARWWHPLEGNKVECRLCPRECHIPNGSRGFCFVRANVDGRLELTTYGRSSGFCIDPVEKKPLNHFLPGTPILSFGTAGCNLGCKFCQNWDISKSREVDKLAHFASPEAIVEAAVEAGCRSLAFTYNDPVIWAEYAIDIAKVAHARGLKTVAVTAGYISEEARGEFYEHIDAANVDLKAFTDNFYNRLCQVKLNPILDTLKWLHRETNVWVELTNLMIPGENDSPDETKAMCAWIVENLGPDVPVHFTAFHPDFKMRDKPNTPPATLVRARQIARAAGIRYAYVGNVNDVANQSTYCHSCGKLLIQRDWYELGEYHLRGNACAFCGTTIPGIFDPAGPGKWGRKRQAITIGGGGDEPRQLVSLTTSAPAAQATTHTKGLNVLNLQPPASQAPAAPANPAPQSAAPQINFTSEQDAHLLAYARATVGAALRNELFPSVKLPDLLAQAPAYGIFVSLFRGDQLRSCKGQWAGADLLNAPLSPLGPMLASVSRDAACNDPRFPRVTVEELPFLTVEISLMHSPALLTTRGTDRIANVHVGTHGLVIRHPRGSGLLLPHVATEQGWDSRTFLEQVCQKAGLPPQTWADDQAALMTFQARKLTDPAPAAELDLQKIGANGLGQILQYIHFLLSGQAETANHPAIPSAAQAPLLHENHPENLGLALLTASGANGAAVAPNSNLITLAKSAAQSLANSLAQRHLREPVQRMSVLWRPQTLVAADYPHRHRHLAQHAVLAQVDNRSTLVTPQPDRPNDPILQALAHLNITHQQWLEGRTASGGAILLKAFNILQCQNNQAGPVAPPAAAAASAQVRPSSRAGMFYPAAPEQAVAEVDTFLRAGGLGTVPTQKYRAIMLPHAGWRFCGSTMGKTLAAAQLPKTAIVLSPKHTALGPTYSIANHAAWAIPGANIPVATGLVQRLARAIPQMQCEPEAHREEHGIEVLLPFLLRLRPDLQFVPIVLGNCDFDLLGTLARELTAIRRDAKAANEEPPLLIISSDMNHFATEPENRRRDQLALDAMQSGNPRQLFETCMTHGISMCGLLPAITIMQALIHETPTINPRLIDYTTSAAASGDTARVVGYAGVVIE